MKKIILGLFIVSLSLGVFAKNEENKTDAENSSAVKSTIQLSGVVTDKTSKEALVGVEVKIEGTTQKVYTDFDGKFTFTNLNPGEYNLVASYISYEKNVVEHINVNKNNQVSILLESSN